jgi:transcriptional regulator with XRE-family HTH domain
MDMRGVVGGNVRRLRQLRGLTQEQLAFDAQIDLTYLGGIERGRRNPSLLVMDRLAQSLSVELAALVSAGDA